MYEPDESFTVTLWNPVNAVLGRVHSATGTLVNDDPVPALLTAFSSAVDESNVLTAELRFTVALSNPNQDDVQVNFATSDGTANAGSDYHATNGILVFPAGVTTQTVSVIVKGDIEVEPDETLQLLLSGAVNATVAANATGTIANDDAVPGKFDHFIFDPIPSLRLTNAPFRVTIRAADYVGDSVTNSPASTQLAALGAGAGIVAPSTLTNFTNGVWSGFVTLPNVATNVTLRAQDSAGLSAGLALVHGLRQRRTPLRDCVHCGGPDERSAVRRVVLRARCERRDDALFPRQRGAGGGARWKIAARDADERVELDSRIVERPGHGERLGDERAIGLHRAEWRGAKQQSVQRGGAGVGGVGAHYGFEARGRRSPHSLPDADESDLPIAGGDQPAVCIVGAGRPADSRHGNGSARRG